MYECLLSIRHHALRLSTNYQSEGHKECCSRSWCVWVPGWGRHRFTTKRMCEVKLGLGWAPSTAQLSSKPQCLFPLAWSQKEVQVISLSSVYKVSPLSLEQIKAAIHTKHSKPSIWTSKFSFLKKTSSGNSDYVPPEESVSTPPS